MLTVKRLRLADIPLSALDVAAAAASLTDVEFVDVLLSSPNRRTGIIIDGDEAENDTLESPTVSADLAAEFIALLGKSAVRNLAT
jgi:hypothetical protein